MENNLFETKVTRSIEEEDSIAIGSLYERLRTAEETRAHVLHELLLEANSGNKEALAHLTQSTSRRAALYPGSFDPFTKGHLDVVERAVEMFDQIIIGVGVNSGKQPLFSVQERIAIIERDTRHLTPKVRVVAFSDATIDLATRESAPVILRGVREVTDFTVEMALAHVNREQSEGSVETLLFPARPDISFVSSSVARELARLDKDLSRYLTEDTEFELRNRLAGRALKSSWEKVCKAYQISNLAMSDEFEEIVAAYRDNSRRYHSLEHIVRMLEDLDQVNSSGFDRNMVVLAIDFHDIVLKPGSSENETASARHASDWLLEQGVSASVANRVATLIETTKEHRPAKSDIEACLLCDLDLSVLASSKERYMRYAKGIRQEYAHVALSDYRNGRCEFLENILSRDKIFSLLTDREKQARTNMQHEMAALVASNFPVL